jgi:hypothetical protein
MLTKMITFNLPPPPSPALSCSTDASIMEESCMLCAHPEDDSTSKICKLCTEVVIDGLADVVTVPSVLLQ